MGGEEEDYCDCDLSWSSRHCPACSSSLPPLHHACPPHAHGAAASIPGLLQLLASPHLELLLGRAARWPLDEDSDDLALTAAK